MNDLGPLPKYVPCRKPGCMFAPWRDGLCGDHAIERAVEAERSACAHDLGLNRIDITTETRAALRAAEDRMMKRGKVEVKT